MKLDLDSKVRFETTPNPQTLRFSAPSLQSDRTADFKSPTEAQFAPLPKKLFGFPWCAGVFVGRDFMTVTKQDWVDWDIIAEPLANLIEEHLVSGQPVLPAAAPASSATHPTSQTNGSAPSPSASSVETIIRVLNEEIRPMVAQDGGDVVFAKYEDKVVYLHMQGSCAGCPSSTMTLKMGIETRLKEAVPEIVEVVAI